MPTQGRRRGRTRQAAGSTQGEDGEGGCGGAAAAVRSCLVRANGLRWTTLCRSATAFFLPQPALSPLSPSARGESEQRVQAGGGGPAASACWHAPPSPPRCCCTTQLDIPLPLRHPSSSVDQLLSYGRSCCLLRVQSLAGDDSRRGDILDVISLLQSAQQPQPQQEASAAALPLAVLHAARRGVQLLRRARIYRHGQPPLLRRPAATACIVRRSGAAAACPWWLPTASCTATARSEPAAVRRAPREAHQQQAHAGGGCGGGGRLPASFVLEMRSLLSADAWVCGIRQLLKKRQRQRTAAELQDEQLDWEQVRQPAATGRTTTTQQQAAAAGTAAASRCTQPQDGTDAAALGLAAGSFHYADGDAGGRRGGGGGREQAARQPAGRTTPSASTGRTLTCSSATAVCPQQQQEAAAEAEVDSPDFHSVSSAFSSVAEPLFHLHSPTAAAQRPQQAQQEGGAGRAQSEPPSPPPARELEAGRRCRRCPTHVPPAPAHGRRRDDIPCAPPLSDVPVRASHGPRGCGGRAGGEAEAAALGDAERRRGSDLSRTIFASLSGRLDDDELERLLLLFAAQPPAGRRTAGQDEAEAAAGRRALSAAHRPAPRAEHRDRPARLQAGAAGHRCGHRQLRLGRADRGAAAGAAELSARRH